MGRVPSRGSDQFVVRFPEGLRDRIKESAEKSGRSMNAEIVAALEEKFPEPKDKFTLDEFYKKWYHIIIEAHGAVQRDLLIDRANDELHVHRPDIFIWTETKNGNVVVYLGNAPPERPQRSKY